MATEAAEPVYGRLQDLAFGLVREAGALGGMLPARLAETVAPVVRLANARHSIRIDDDGVSEEVHLHVERRIDQGFPAHPASAEFLRWVFRELFYFEGLTGDLARFESVYTAVPGQFRQVVAVPASWHRLMQLRPFELGNAMVARLMAHAALMRLEIASLWSVSRALARDLPRYRELIAAPGEPDDTGISGDRALMEFCRFFLAVASAEVRAMRALLEPAALLGRVESYCAEERDAGRLPDGSFAVLREVMLRGELPRAHVETVVPFRERKARQISSALRECGLLVADGVRAPLRLAIPPAVAERWLPGLLEQERLA